MEKPTRSERSRLQRLRQPVFMVKIDRRDVVRRIETQGVALERRP
jgi:hypothetical protein